VFKKILVPLDGSDLAARVLPQVEDLAKCTQAEITLITIGNTLIAGTVGDSVPVGFADFCVQLKAQAEKRLIEAARTVKDVKVDWVYKEGAAAAEIIAYAAENSFDLIAMATHGMGEVAWVIGSVAEKVVRRATVPVLLLRVLGPGRPSAKTRPTMT
jgi:nucleotide-binding universal stress UspA family protein